MAIALNRIKRMCNTVHQFELNIICALNAHGSAQVHAEGEQLFDEVPQMGVRLRQNTDTRLLQLTRMTRDEGE